MIDNNKQDWQLTTIFDNHLSQLDNVQKSHMNMKYKWINKLIGFCPESPNT